MNKKARVPLKIMNVDKYCALCDIINEVLGLPVALFDSEADVPPVEKIAGKMKEVR
ncbi:MAG: hypothetical protein HQK89_01505 [Nitrospirae bacterium]|nr:hypothetical protein [Nitrospirota bacterium]